jgi:glutamate carboxypeptidase
MSTHALRVLVQLGVFLGLAIGSPAAIAAPDAKLLDAATREHPALIDTLERLVKIESGSNDHEGLMKLATVLEKRLQGLGFKTERRKTAAGAGADIVIGILSGSGNLKIMLQAHMDTVYPTGILLSQPYKRDGNRLYGPGIADDKGGIAVILHSLKILNDAGWKDYARLTVLFNPDEEVGSDGSGETIASLADESDVVLSYEPTGTGGNEWLLLGAASHATAFLEVKGRSSHAGVSPEAGRNAVMELAHQLLQTRDVAKDIPGVQLNWTNVVSNKAINQIPDLAIATGDVRITTRGAEQKLLAALQAKVHSSKLVTDTETSVRIVAGRPGFVANGAGYAVAERARDIYAELGRNLWLVPMTKGATDAGFAGRSGKAAVVESLGLAGSGYHARDEYIEIDSIVPRLYLTTRLLTELGKHKVLQQGR